MKTTKTVKVANICGGVNEVTVTITDEHKGQILGLAIRGNDRIVDEATDHIEAEDADTMTFDFGTVRKDRIESLEYHNDGFGSTVRRVRFAKI
jgi:hypothetical protein